ncbi:nucleotidyltransferase domain-containing protein [Thermofilum sp.]|uniref:nucleotidyltransferase family protein n=1 Tax=Thermofilum sp. TaxID=1961369 RepID=UPI003167AE0B
MNRDTVIEILRNSSRMLADAFGEEFVGMILFGSWARGEAEADSDVDVLVVFRSFGGFEARSKVYSIIAEHVKMPLTLIDARLGEITSEDYELTPLMLNILYDGIVIWDRDGVLKDFVEKGRKLIEGAKLVRYKVPDGKYGWKRADGKPIALCDVNSG